MKKGKKTEATNTNIAAVNRKNPETIVSEKALEKQHKADKETVRKGISSFVATGTALARIRDTRSFVTEGYDNFESFCEIEFDFTPQYGNRLIVASTEFKKLPEKTQEHITTETQMKALAKAPEEKREEIISKVASEGAVTEKAITKKIKEKKEKAAPAEFDEVILDALDFEVPKPIVSEWKRAKALAKHLRKLASEIHVALKQDDPILAEVKALHEDAKALHHSIEDIDPYVRCPKCEGKGCAVCSKRGWISKTLYKMSGNA